MSDTLADLASWLPSEFLTDDDVLLMDKENFANNRNNNTVPFCFPTEFPYEFGSPSSTESEGEEEEFAAVLTRRFSRSLSVNQHHKISYGGLANIEKKRVFSGSPESTLSWPFSTNGSPSQGPSPPATPYVPGNDDAWGLIYAAAGQVARMKVNMMNVNHNDVVCCKNRGLLGAPRSLAHHNPQCSIWRSEREELLLLSRQKQHLCQNRVGAVAGSARPLPQSAWPPLHAHNHRPNQHQPCNGSVIKPVFLAGSGGCGGRAAAAPAKRECAGTGVFLPRRYSNNPAESRKKPAACPPAHLPAKVTAQSLNKNFDPTTIAQPNINASLISQYEILMARRNVAMLAAQRRSGGRRGGVGGGLDVPMNHPEVLLPQEWTY